MILSLKWTQVLLGNFTQFSCISSEMMTEIFALLKRQCVWREHSRFYHNLLQSSPLLRSLIQPSILYGTLLHLPVPPLTLAHCILPFSLAYGYTCLPRDHSNQYTNVLVLGQCLLKEETFSRSCIWLCLLPLHSHPHLSLLRQNSQISCYPSLYL